VVIEPAPPQHEARDDVEPPEAGEASQPREAAANAQARAVGERAKTREGERAQTRDTGEDSQTRGAEANTQTRGAGETSRTRGAEPNTQTHGTRLADQALGALQDIGHEHIHFWRRCRMVIVGAVAASITDRMTLAAAGCAFYATLALFPAISMLISVYGLAFNPDAVAAQLQVLQGLVPGPAFTLISDRARELGSQPPGSLSTGLAVSFVLTFWSASTGAKSVMSALNVVHDVKEQRSVLRFQLTGLAMTLAAVLVAALAIALLVFIPAVITFVGLSRYSGGLLHSSAMLLLLGLFGVSLAVLYRIGPSRVPPPHQPILPGIVLATVLWLAASSLLSWYVSHISSFGTTYGSLGAVVGIMFWFYGSAYVVLLGAELNARLEATTGTG
jgi:membrane protein